MGTVKGLKDSFPILIRESVSSYFQPALWLLSFFKGLLNEGSPSQSILSTEIQKLQDVFHGKEWLTIHESIDKTAHNSLERAMLRKARINWIITSHNEVYLNFISQMYKSNKAIEELSNELRISSIFDLESEIAKSDKNLTYNILVLDEAHHSIAISNIVKYKEIIKATNSLPLSFTANRSADIFEVDDEYIDFSNLSSSTDASVAITAIKLKIERFISSIPR